MTGEKKKKLKGPHTITNNVTVEKSYKREQSLPVESF